MMKLKLMCNSCLIKDVVLATIYMAPVVVCDVNGVTLAGSHKMVCLNAVYLSLDIFFVSKQSEI